MICFVCGSPTYGRDCADCARTLSILRYEVRVRYLQ